MAYIIYIGKDGKRNLLAGKEYEPVAGTARLNIRTGTGKDAIRKYGWTSDSTASQYSPLRVVIKDGLTAYLGRLESSSKSYTQDIVTRTFPVTRSYTSYDRVLTALTYSTSSSPMTTATYTRASTYDTQYGTRSTYSTYRTESYRTITTRTEYQTRQSQYQTNTTVRSYYTYLPSNLMFTTNGSFTQSNTGSRNVGYTWVSTRWSLQTTYNVLTNTTAVGAMASGTSGSTKYSVFFKSTNVGPGIIMVTSTASIYGVTSMRSSNAVNSQTTLTRQSTYNTVYHTSRATDTYAASSYYTQTTGTTYRTRASTSGYGTRAVYYITETYTTSGETAKTTISSSTSTHNFNI